MDQPFHDWGNQREGKGQDKAWWEVDSIVSGSYDGDTFVRRVMDHLSSQDEPIGDNPPTYGDLFRGKTRDGPLGHLGRPPEPKTSGVATPQVSSVVQVPGKAKAESDDCPKIQALRASAEAEVWGYLLQRKACVSPTGTWTVWRGQDTTEAGPPCVSSPGVCPEGREEEGHGEDPP